MRKRMNAVTAILMILAILFASCSPSATDGDSTGTAGEDRTRTETKEPVKGDTNGDILTAAEKPCGGKVFSVDLAEDEIMLDILSEGDGYVLLTGTPHDFGEENSALSIRPEKIRTESKLALYDSRYRMLDAGFQPTGEGKPTPEEVTYSEFRIGDDRYRYVCTGYEIEHGSFQKVTFSLMKGDKTFCNLASAGPDSGGYLPNLVWAEQDGILYTLEKLNGNAILRRDGYGLSAPEGEADGTNRWIEGLGKVGDTVYAIMGEAGGSLKKTQAYLAPLDAETTKIGIEGQRMEVCPDYEGIMASAEGKTAFLSGTHLYLLEEEGLYHLTDLAIYGVGPQSLVRRILILPDDKLLVLTADTIITLMIGEEEIESVTFGVVGNVIDPNELENAVAAYNRTGRGIPARIRYFDDIAKLNLALLSGEIDLIGTREITELRNYADKGVLWALEETKTVLLKEGELIPSVVKSAEWKGKTFYLPDRVSFWGAYAARRFLASGGPVTDMSGFLKMIRGKYPGFMRGKVGIDEYDWAFSRDLDQWIDWEKGSCHFDDGSFAEFLSFCGDCAKDVDEAAANPIEEPLAGLSGLHSVEAYEYFLESIPGFMTIEEEKELLPYPSGAHEGGYAIEAKTFFGVVGNSDKRENALDLMEYLLLEAPEVQSDNFMSVSRKACEKVIDDYLEGYRNAGGSFDKVTGPTIAAFKATVENSYGYLYTENEIMKVMREEALRFFAGELTAEKAAEYVQNRVSIYLAEQG